MEVIVSTVLILLFVALSSKTLQRYFLLNKYKTVIELFDYFLDKAYTLIYNDQIIAYTASGQTTIPPDEMETIERNFIKLAFELMGEANKKMFILFFGGQTSTIDNMLIFVRKELSQDAIAKLIQEQESNVK
jgi:hypothetical protein